MQPKMRLVTDIHMRNIPPQNIVCSIIPTPSSASRLRYVGRARVDTDCCCGFGPFFCGAAADVVSDERGPSVETPDSRTRLLRRQYESTSPLQISTCIGACPLMPYSSHPSLVFVAIDVGNW